MHLGPRQDDCLAGAKFYTCVDGFSGCCSADACGLGSCPDEVHQINRRTVTMLGGPATTSPAAMFSLAAPSSTATFLGYYTIPSASATADASPSSSAPKSKTGIIVGATIGSVLFLALAAFVAVIFLRKRGGRQMHFGSRGTTPMLRSHGESDGEEKPEARDTPDSGDLRGSGGLFTPFGGQLPRTALK
jgi:hypothetical protein